MSVVSGEEARRALAGGADIIDVKDPGEGALGAHAPRVLSEVLRVVGTAAPVSVALGDLPDLPHTAALAAHGAAVSGARYVKVGLRGVRDLERAVAIMSAVADAVRVGGDGVAVIAAAYADAAALDPPALAPECLPELVGRTGIAGALVDTFTKDGRGLYGWVSEAELADLIDRTRRAGAGFAVAGQLRPGELCRVAADVVGVRSAVCREGDRTAELRAELVAAAVAELRAGGTDKPGTIRVPGAGEGAGARTTTATPVRRTASGT
ncbi:MAG: (5-formylfuran-3-yl)methyl phosphate synthase [Solirubrobacteraceae bacterium]